MNKREFVPKRQVAKFTGFDLEREADFRLSRLSKLGLIYQVSGAYVGYTLNYSGYDCLAINAFVKAGVLEALGKPLGVGKEADVYDALSPTGERIAVKFHRLGRISFRQTVRKRGYTAQRGAGWLFRSRLAAEKEFRALKLVFPCGVAVPRPISQNRHVLIMGMIEGAELADYREIGKPQRVLREILGNVRRAYVKAHVVHADLSEFNIILKPDGHILIIDWPQYVTFGHPNAQDLLRRDVKNVLKYFKRKHKLNANLRTSLEYVTGSRRTAIL
jgi:RIO kinase 2